LKRGTGSARRTRKRAPDAVFVNCPFDTSYRSMFDAIVFTVIALRFDVRCALERDTGTEERLGKIARAIGECRFGIHDISFMRIDKKTNRICLAEIAVPLTAANTGLVIIA
jgi:hypothetical protein